MDGEDYVEMELRSIKENNKNGSQRLSLMEVGVALFGECKMNH